MDQEGIESSRDWPRDWRADLCRWTPGLRHGDSLHPPDQRREGHRHRGVLLLSGRGEEECGCECPVRARGALQGPPHLPAVLLGGELRAVLQQILLAVLLQVNIQPH